MADDKAGLHKGYEHWVRPAPINEDWDKDLNFVLIKTLDELRVHDVEHKFVAWDTETSGLNPEMDWIVGFSFSFDGITGYYVPVRHDDIALGKEALDIFYSILKKAGTQFLYNCRFDQRFMEYAGYDLEGLRYYDAMNAIWLADTNVVLPSLKASERHYMGWTPKTFSETLGDATTFQHVPAEEAYKYACLVGETEVCMSDKSLKKIEDIKVGDVVQTMQGNRQVTAVYDNGTRSVCKLVFMDGTVIYATKDHKFLVWTDPMQRDWMTVGQIMSLSCQHLIRLVTLNDDGSLDYLCIDLSASTLDLEEQRVYDIQVKDVHNFRLSNGIISHNCTDAIGTYRIAMISNQFYVENKPASQYDNEMLYPLMRLENTPQRLDTEYLLSLRPQVDETIEHARDEVYRLAGREFNLNSPQQFGKILVERFAVDTGARTATGAMKADLKTVDAWLTKNSARAGQDVKDFLKAYKEYKKTVKFKSAYLDKYIKAAQEQDKFPIRFSYKVQSVPCLTDRNTVLVKDRGFCSIGDVKADDFIWTAWGYKRVLWNNSHIVYGVYRACLENGMYIEGTGHHPVLVRTSPLDKVDPRGMTTNDVEWAGIADLKVGEPVITNHTSSVLSCTDKNRCSLARVLGYFFGNGYITDSNSMCLFFDDIQMSVFYRDLLCSVFGGMNVIYKDIDIHHVEYYVPKEDVQKAAHEWSCVKDIAIGMARSPETFRHFLVGYIDSLQCENHGTGVKGDMSCRVEGNEVTLNIPKHDGDIIVPILWACAIPCDVSVTDNTLHVRVCEPYALSNLLSLWDSYDAGRSWFKSIFIPESFRLYSESCVKSVEYVEEPWVVYDIEVEDVHEYVANGIVTHNTGRLSCGADAKNSFFTKNNVQCLEENTSVLTSDGLKPIKDIITGDLVWTGSEFVPCIQLGAKTKRCETVHTHYGKITASLEHKFYTLNLSTFELEWDMLAHVIAMGKPVIRNKDDGGFTFREMLECDEYKQSVLLRPELSEEQIAKLDDKFVDVRFDMVRKTDYFWYPNIMPPEVTVYDLYVPTHERFTANGFIVHNSTPKPHAIMLKGRKATEQEITEKKDILGWYFSNDIPDEEAKGLVEGMEPGNLNIRRAFLPENDQCYVVSIDMCLEGGSPVQTKRGYMGICEMKPGDEVWSPQGWVPVSRVMRTGVEKVIKVCPDNGGQAIYCTENHPFVINGEKVKAKDIKGKVPSVPFHAYVKESDERNKVVERLSCLKQYKTIKEASRYVIEHDLKPLIEDALENYTRAEVAKWCGIRVSSFGHFMNDLGIQPTGKAFSYSQSKFYNNVFAGESTPTSAYLFGYILGDGNISRRRGDYLTLNISSKDEAHLRQICNIFGSDLNIRHNEKKGCEWWCLNIPSREICNRLLSLGIAERKSTEPSNIDFEWLGENFRHFIRGLFDSDGYVRITTVLDVSFVGHDSYITEIKKRIEGQWSYKYTPSLSHLSLLGTVEQRQFIYEYLYKEATIWLQRKRDVFDSWYEDKFGDVVLPVWNCTVDTKEHLYLANSVPTSNCAEELRIVANLCHEDTWINAFNSGADVHKACYSPDTEFLTKDGWKLAEDITPSMEIAYYDKINDGIKFTRANKRATHIAKDVYVRDGIFNVTDNHRMYIEFGYDGYQILTAEELKRAGNPRQRFHMKTAVGSHRDFDSIVKGINSEVYFLMGFIMPQRRETIDGQTQVTLSKPCTHFSSALLSHCITKGRTNEKTFVLSREATRQIDMNGYLLDGYKALYTMPQNVTQKFLEEFACGLVYSLSILDDSSLYIGNGIDTHGSVYLHDKALADAAQYILTSVGIMCRVTYNCATKRYLLRIDERKGLRSKQIGSTFYSIKHETLTDTENPVVYSCFSVPSGLLLTRYQGRITVNGNTAIKLFGEENYSKDARKKAKCVAGDMVVHTVDGHAIKLRNLVSDDIRDDAQEGVPVPLETPIKVATPEGFSKVTHWINNGVKRTLRITIERHLVLEVTPDHLVGKFSPDASDDLCKKYVLVRADSLNVGDMLLWDYAPMKITGIEDGESDVYDITVDNESHTFHANGIVVHNCASFGILYGSGAQGFNNSFPDMTLDECREFMTKFKAALPNITSGQQAYVEHAKIYGCVPTAFGRMRRVRWFLQSGDRAKVAFGERTVKNCYSPDTEFLTKDGWKLAKDITPTTQLAYYEPDMGTVKYTDAGERYTHKCTESVVYKSIHGSWDVTTNHRMWVSPDGKVFSPVVADDLCGMDKFTVVTSSSVDESIVTQRDADIAFSCIADDGYVHEVSYSGMAFLLGVCIRRGVITYENGGGSTGGTLTVTCDESQRPVIDNLTVLFGGMFTFTNRLQAGKYLRMLRFCQPVCDYVKENIGCKRKQFSIPSWLHTSDRETIEAFIAGLVGQKAIEHPNDLYKFRTHDGKLADDIQRLCTVCGFHTRLMVHDDEHGNKSFTLHLKRMSRMIIGNRKREDNVSRPVHKVTHDEMEYSCFEVPSHILVTRHNGFVSYHMNTTVQGTAADVLKLIFCRLWKHVFKPYPQVKFMSTIHDEVNFSIPIELAREVIPKCMKCMTIKREDWPVTLKCSLSISRTDLGSLIPFTYDFENDTYEPEWDTLEVKPKKKEEPKPVENTEESEDGNEASCDMEVHFEFLTDEDMLF